MSDEERGNTTYRSNIFGEYDKNQTGLTPDWRPFSLLYLQLEKQIVEQHIIGGGDGGSVGKTWLGSMYCKLNVDGDDLNFKIPVKISTGGEYREYCNNPGIKIRNFQSQFQKNFYPYFYYSDSILNFKLFTTDERKLYFITKK